MKKAAIHTLGCKVNTYESEAMIRLLEDAGYEIVPFETAADVYVINTCTVTGVADRKSRQMLHRARKMNPDALIVAAGCYVQADAKRALEDAAVDLVVGNDQKGQLVRLIEEGGSAVLDINRKTDYEELYVDRFTEHTRAFLKIQDGCNQFCSYCLIPYVRGRIRSRRPEDAVAEARRLTASGCREIVLTGIHLSSYGVDTCDDSAWGTPLLELIEALSAIDGLERIRLGSLEPRLMTEEFVRRLSGCPKVCPHFHLSLQSGCDATLKRMNRHYTTEEYAANCAVIRKYYAHPAICTDVITGFPGETEEEFAATVRFLKQIRLYEMHIFPYSVRKGTRAEHLPGQVPDAVKRARSSVLLEMTARHAADFRAYYQGQPLEILVEEAQETDGIRYVEGFTKEYVKVKAVSDAEIGSVITVTEYELTEREGD